MGVYDVVIIGKGPAAVSGALYTARANLKTLLIGLDDSALNKASEIENYYGFETPVSGKTLLEAGLNQARRLHIEIVTEEVLSVSFGETGGFMIKTAKDEYSAKALLIAAGQPHKTIAIPGLKDFEGKGVSYCTTCDGFFFKNLTVGVLGYGDYALEEALELERFTKDITIYTNGRELELTEAMLKLAGHFKINRKPVKGLEGDTVLRQIVLEDSAEPIRGLFVAYGSASSVDFAVKLGIAVSNNAIIADENQKTNVDGIFAAGDCTGGFKQVSTAVGQGAMSGKSIISYLKNKERKE